jgi:hypothetical protein
MAVIKLEGVRSKVQLDCTVCGTSMLKYSSAKYCSNACKMKAKYKRKRKADVKDMPKITCAHPGCKYSIGTDKRRRYCKRHSPTRS